VSVRDGLQRAAPDLTPGVAAQLISGAKLGLFRSAVAETVGLDPDVLDTWLTMGLSSSAVDPYRSFAREYRAAEQLSQLPYLQSIQAAATTDYRAAIAWLEMRFPDQWGAKATKNTSAGVLAPSAGDEAAEEALVDQLFGAMPDVLRRVLERHGYVRAVTQSAKDAAAPDSPPPD
jgi:hypothetical protein